MDSTTFVCILMAASLIRNSSLSTNGLSMLMLCSTGIAQTTAIEHSSAVLTTWQPIQCRVTCFNTDELHFCSMEMQILGGQLNWDGDSLNTPSQSVSGVNHGRRPKEVPWTEGTMTKMVIAPWMLLTTLKNSNPTHDWLWKMTQKYSF